MGEPDFYVERDLNPKRVSGVRKQSGGLFSAAKSEAGTVQSTVAEDAACEAGESLHSDQSENPVA